MQLRHLFRPHFKSVVGCGSSVNAWFDSWCDVGPLFTFITPRMIHAAGFNMASKVADIHANANWLWPEAWNDLFPVIIDPKQYSLNPSSVDYIRWKDGSRIIEFSTSAAWNSVRISTDEVNWAHLVWSPHCIPRHSFILWLILGGKLLTQDKILSWNMSRRKNMNMMCCLLCFSNVDSHDHLFFECTYFSSIWSVIAPLACMESVLPRWSDIVSHLLDRVRSKRITNVISRLLVSAAAYFIWQERNKRIFMNKVRPPEILSSLIIDTVRCKLMGLKFKETTGVRRTLQEWKIYGNSVFDDGG
jgi:hypothetical protein